LELSRQPAFFRIARGSLNETKHRQRRAFRRKLLTEAQIALKPLLDGLSPGLNAYLNSIGRKEPQDQGNDEGLSH
jgi:hypothetical protein